MVEILKKINSIYEENEERSMRKNNSKLVSILSHCFLRNLTKVSVCRLFTKL